MKKILTRQEFIKLSAMASLAAPILGYSSCSSRSEKKQSEETSSSITYSDAMGLQVFGIRELLEQDPQSTLKSISEIGIKNIELFDPSSLKKFVPIINDLGMTALSTHFLSGYITGKWDTVKSIGMAPPENYKFEHIVEDCAASGVKYLGIAILMPEERESLDDFKRFADLANQHGAMSQQAGVQLYYHNHSFEFKPTEGAIPFDEMLKLFDPKLVKIELDVFWAAIAGVDPIEWIKRLNSQLIFLHLKDLKSGTPTDYSVFNVDPAAFLEIGSGSLDYPTILKEAKAAGVQVAFLDQDHTAMDKIESVKKSYDYLKELGI